jgi:hypothetical protein
MMCSGPTERHSGAPSRTIRPTNSISEAVANYLGALSPPANGLIEVQVTAGRAIVAGITVDNTTNDTALQFGTRNHF